ncbi:MAG: AAA family ATPase [Oxalobacter sp.]|nr:AAA family ATPase [Oxalobacter sp.]
MSLQPSQMKGMMMETDFSQAFSKMQENEVSRRHSRGFHPVMGYLTRIIDRIDENDENGNDNTITGLPTGFHQLDSLTAGLQLGDLIILAGRPAMGKTAFASNIAEHVAMELNVPVGYFSIEMGATRLTRRMLGAIGNLDLQRIRTGNLQENDWDRLSAASNKITGAQLYINETPKLDIVELRASAGMLAEQCGQIGLIIVDYLQQIEPLAPESTHPLSLPEMARELKSLAEELNCPVLVVSRLERNVDQRLDKRPILSDLDEYGPIEQYADVVWFLYRDEIHHPGPSNKGMAELIVAKQPDGPTGTVGLVFHKEFVKFDSVDSGG